MNQRKLKQIFLDTDYVHTSGSAEELRAAEYLKARCEEMGVSAHLEGFSVPMGEIEEAVLLADGKEIPCRGLSCCGSGTVEAELLYLPSADKVSLASARDKIVLLDTQGVDPFVYKDMMQAGVKGILFRYGNRNFPNRDIDQRDLRPHVVGEEKKVLCAMVNAQTAMDLVKNRTRDIRLSILQKEYEGRSHNVVAELPGAREEVITLSAHYDTTSLSHGSYDNMSGCVGLLGVMEQMKKARLNYGLRFVFCGSEERGLLGSKAYVRDHEAEMEKTALNINLDMIGSVMGKFIACVTAEEKLAGYISYLGAELGFPVQTRVGVYSSDSTSFADKGVPALSFARSAGPDMAPIHCRYDLPDVLSMEQLQKDINFIACFTGHMASAVLCPVSREFPEKVKKELDEYLFRKRKENG